MNLRIGRVLELSWHIVVRIQTENFFSLIYSARHPLIFRCCNYLCPIHAQYGPVFLANRFRHHQDQPVSPGCGYNSQANAGVATGGFNDNTAGLDTAILFCLFHHLQGYPVLDAAARVIHFHFGHYHSRSTGNGFS